MKTLGLIGGTTWVSTIDYYRYINRLTNERLGGSECARIVLYSVNFAELMIFVNADDWESAAGFLSEIAIKLEKAGADAIVLCANTTHITAETVQSNVKIPVLHIVDAVADEIRRHDLRKVGLLGTRFTMERDFFKDRLGKSGIATIIPDENDRDFVHNSIYNELGKDIFRDETKQEYVRIINELQKNGAQGVILGCTEIPMLIKQPDCTIPAFDTTLIHATYAVDFALS
jgi:aspartate racemase